LGGFERDGELERATATGAKGTEGSEERKKKGGAKFLKKQKS